MLGLGSVADCFCNSSLICNAKKKKQMSLIKPHLHNVTPWNPKHVEQVHKERIKFSFTNWS